MAEAAAEDLIKVPAAPSKGVGMGAIIAVAVFAIAASSGIAYFLMSKMTAQSAVAADGEVAPEAKADPVFYAMEPAFVVNLSDANVVRYLQVEAEIVARDPDALEKLDAVMPLVRNRLVLLFSAQTYAQVNQRAGKEALQLAALEQVREVLGPAGKELEALIFTSFVIQ